jgi:hypothetical protein
MAVATAALSTSWVGTNEPLAVEAMAVATAALETSWVGTNEPLAVEARAIATAALSTSWIGTAAGDTAYGLATYAISLSGTTVDVNLSAVYDVAWAGTAAAAVSMSVAATALSTAWAGTGAAAEAYNLGRTALDTSWVGTSAAAAAMAVATVGLDTSWVGTSAATAAQGQANASYNIGRTALDTSWVGTISHSSTSPVTGTVTFNMAGPAYQSAILSGTTVVTVSNIVAPTTTYIQAISARLQHDYTGSNHTLIWDVFPSVGVEPPLRLNANKSVFASFTSYGATIQDVFVAAVPQT